VEAVATRFHAHPHEFMAVCDGARVVGLCSRSQVNGLISGRYGFALHSRRPIGERLLADALMWPAAGDLHGLLSSAFSRGGDAVLHDAIVVTTQGELEGLIGARTLVAAQSALVQNQLERLAEQRVELQRANDELSRSLAQQRILEKQIVQKEKNAMLQTLVGGIAHELNNKLMPVLGYAELLIADVTAGDTSNVLEYSRTLRDAAVEGANIVRALLQLSRPVAVERRRFDLREVVEQSVTLTALRAREGGIGVDVVAPERTVAVTGDPSQIKQVLINLLFNALDAVEHAGTKSVRLTVTMADDGARVAVSDSGSGIPEEHLSRIFDPFFTTKGPSKGTGLGLGVSASIVRQHGGTIDVRSCVGRGSTFTITLPLAREANDGPRAPTPAPFRGSASPSAPAALDAVLVVDDDDLVASVVSDTVRRRLGVQPERVADAAAARHAVEGRFYDLVLCDVRMPGSSGLTFLSWMRERHPAQASRVILMTGEMGQTSLDEEILLCAVPVLRKPFTADSFFDQVCAVLQTAPGAAHARA
jgi:signal transduction histidine kinase/CheY-like chemotaxis protein